MDAEPRVRTSRLSLAAFGPGLVFVLAAVGMGDFISNASLGAAHGYGYLWLLALGVTFRFTWLDTSARYVLASGEPFIDGIARFGRPLLLALLVVAPMLSHVLNLARIVLFAQIAQSIVPLPSAQGAAAYGIVFVVASVLAIVRGGYPLLEGFSKWLIAALSVGLMAAAFVSHPNATEMMRGFIPSFPPTTDVRATLLMVTALIGTEAGSLNNLSYASFLRAKGWLDVRSLEVQRRDLILSLSAIFLIGMLTQVVAATSLYHTTVQLKTASDLIQIVASKLGTLGVVLVTIGLAAKVFSSTVGGTTGNALVIIELARRLHWRAGATGAAKPSDSFKWIAAALVISPSYGLFTSWTPVTLVLISQAAGVVVVPMLTFVLLRLSSHRERMGAYASGPLRTTLLAVMTLVSLWVLAQNAVAWATPLFRTVAAWRLTVLDRLVG